MGWNRTQIAYFEGVVKTVDYGVTAILEGNGGSVVNLASKVWCAKNWGGAERNSVSRKVQNFTNISVFNVYIVLDVKMVCASCSSRLYDAIAPI